MWDGVRQLAPEFSEACCAFPRCDARRVMEVLQIVSVLGMHSMSTGLTIMIDALRKSGLGNQVMEGPLTAEQEKDSSTNSSPAAAT
jgi:hypothetical protein